jgi:hypothetical protein
LQQLNGLRWEDTHRVDRLRDIDRVLDRVRIGAPDPNLTPVSGMVAVKELAGRLGVIKRLDARIEPIKTRRRGFSGGQLLVGMASAQLVGEEFLVGLDRQCATWHTNDSFRRFANHR